MVALLSVQVLALTALMSIADPAQLPILWEGTTYYIPTQKIQKRTCTLQNTLSAHGPQLTKLPRWVAHDVLRPRYVRAQCKDAKCHPLLPFFNFAAVQVSRIMTDYGDTRQRRDLRPEAF